MFLEGRKSGVVENREQTISNGVARGDVRDSRSRRNIRPRGRPKARGTVAEAEGTWEVGGPHRSEDTGKRVAPEPVEQRGLVLDTFLRRER